MTVKEGAIVVRISDQKATPTNYRVESVDGRTATIRSLADYSLTEDHVDELRVRYYTDYFDFGDTVRVRKEYADQYNEAEGGNDLTVIANSNTSGRVSTTQVADNNGEEFNILSERLHLVKPAKSFKAGDRVVVDLDLANKYGNDGLAEYLGNVGVLTLTEDSGSRALKLTSHVRYEDDTKETNNVPTRWLKLYEEPAKRVVGEAIKAEDVKEGDTISSEYEKDGLKVEVSGVVGRVVNYGGGVSYLATEKGGVIKTADAKLTLLEEAPDPVDENLQRLLDAEVGDIAFGTYAAEYWIKVGDDEWQYIVGGQIRTTNDVFSSLYKLRYGTLEIYRKVEDAD